MNFVGIWTAGGMKAKRLCCIVYLYGICMALSLYIYTIKCIVYIGMNEYMPKIKI